MIYAMQIRNLKNHENETISPIEIRYDWLNNLITDDQNVFFNKACDYLENVDDYNTDDAKIDDISYKSQEELHQMKTLKVA